jgi:hypothetical protein
MIVGLLMPVYPAQAQFIEAAPATADSALSPAPQISEAGSEKSPLFRGTIDFPSSGDGATSNLQTGGIPEISIAKVAQSTVIASGANAIFTIAITNTSTGGLDLDNIAIDDPHCTTLSPPSGPGSPTTLANGDSWTYTCTVNNVQMGFINTVTATGRTTTGGTFTPPAVTSAKVMISETLNACMVDGINATISHWPFGEAGEPYNDIVSGHHALMGGNQPPTQVTGIVGDGQQFNGTDTGLEAPSPPGNVDYDWSEDEDFSIEIWAKADAGSCASQNEVSSAAITKTARPGGWAAPASTVWAISTYAPRVEAIK